LGDEFIRRERVVAVAVVVAPAAVVEGLPGMRKEMSFDPVP